MTVTYTAEVATCRGFGCFWKLLFRWRGSIYKLLWPELSVYIASYYSLSLVYRFALRDGQKRQFEKVSLYCNIYADLIPVTFILGFYISIVLKRWWDQFVSIPWPDPLALFVSASIHGQDDRGRLMRRTIMRYVNLSLVMTLTCISARVKKRFPTLDHLQEAGILLPNEKKIIEELNDKTPQYPKYWMPLVWASSVVTRARKEGRIRDDFAVKTLIDELCTFRGQCGGLFIYDWISIPLVYTQVVTLAVYTFFFSTVMGRQYLDPDQNYPRHEIDLYVPIFTFLQFFFYMGWLKVAETLVNPFGEDDDDFEMNWLIDRNIQVSYLIVDEMHQEHPELIKDQYWDEVMPPELPYTAASEQYRRDPPKGSAADISVPDHEAEFVAMETVTEEIGKDFQWFSELLLLLHPLSRADDVNGSPEDMHNGSSKEALPLYILSRQLSTSSRSSQSGLANLKRSRQRPSMLSMLQRLFSRDTQPAGMGSTFSLQSHRKRNSQSIARSASKLSSTSRKTNSSYHSHPSTQKDPDSPTRMGVYDDDDDENILTFTVRHRQNSTPSRTEEIFKMSDVSINNSGKSSEWNSNSCNIPSCKDEGVISNSSAPSTLAVGPFSPNKYRHQSAGESSTETRFKPKSSTDAERTKSYCDEVERQENKNKVEFNFGAEERSQGELPDARNDHDDAGDRLLRCFRVHDVTNEDPKNVKYGKSGRTARAFRRLDLSQVLGRILTTGLKKQRQSTSRQASQSEPNMVTSPRTRIPSMSAPPGRGSLSNGALPQNQRTLKFLPILFRGRVCQTPSAEEATIPSFALTTSLRSSIEDVTLMRDDDDALCVRSQPSSPGELQRPLSRYNSSLCGLGIQSTAESQNQQQSTTEDDINDSPLSSSSCLSAKTLIHKLQTGPPSTIPVPVNNNVLVTKSDSPGIHLHHKLYSNHSRLTKGLSFPSSYLPNFERSEEQQQHQQQTASSHGDYQDEKPRGINRRGSGFCDLEAIQESGERSVAYETKLESENEIARITTYSKSANHAPDISNIEKGYMLPRKMSLV